MLKGCFVALEGGEGCGKSTQGNMLRKSFPIAYPDREFVFTREPGGVPYAELIRQVVLGSPAKEASAEVILQLMGAARFDHLQKLILPALERGAVVITDRFRASSYAYQVVAQKGGVAAAAILDLQNRIIDRLLVRTPLHTVIFELEVDVALSRAHARRGQEMTHFDERDLQFHRDVFAGYLEYVGKSGSEAALIDARGTPEEVQARLFAHVARILADN